MLTAPILKCQEGKRITGVKTRNANTEMLRMLRSMEEVYRLAVEWRTKLLLLAVVHEATREGLFQRDADYLAHKTGLGVHTIEVILRRLDAARVIVPVGSSRVNGLYRADLKRLTRRAAFRGDKAGNR